jgi:hypothetical protein
MNIYGAFCGHGLFMGLLENMWVNYGSGNSPYGNKQCFLKLKTTVEYPKLESNYQI